MADALLSEADATQRLATLDGWEVVGGRLHRTLTFADFIDAFGFMAKLALVAEKLDHHPDWSNSWNTVDITISSHDAGGITARCFELAAAANRYA